MALCMERFVNRTDIHAVQHACGARHRYNAVRATLTPELILAHLQGRITLGLYALSDQSTAKWLVIDPGTTMFGRLHSILSRSRGLDLPDPLIEFTGGRGYHFWWFFEDPVAGWEARRMGRAITDKYEIFPREERLPKAAGKAGSLVWAPLGPTRSPGIHLSS